MTLSSAVPRRPEDDMFLARRPTDADVRRFLADSEGLSLSYAPVGIAVSGGGPQPRAHVDELSGVIGRGVADYDRAKQSLREWKHFDLGWVQLFPARAPFEPGQVVAVLVRHLGFWSLNGCRTLYRTAPGPDGHRFGITYGTLTNHAEAGEEIFEVSHDPVSGAVHYRVRAVSWPRAALARIGQPIVRRLQERFRNDSLAAMKRATA